MVASSVFTHVEADVIIHARLDVQVIVVFIADNLLLEHLLTLLVLIRLLREINSLSGKSLQIMDASLIDTCVGNSLRSQIDLRFSVFHLRTLVMNLLMSSIILRIEINDIVIFVTTLVNQILRLFDLSKC